MRAERTTVHVKRRRKLVTKMYVNDEGAMGKCFYIWSNCSQIDKYLLILGGDIVST